MHTGWAKWSGVSGSVLQHATVWKVILVFVQIWNTHNSLWMNAHTHDMLWVLPFCAGSEGIIYIGYWATAFTHNKMWTFSFGQLPNTNAHITLSVLRSVHIASRAKLSVIGQIWCLNITHHIHTHIFIYLHARKAMWPALCFTAHY